MYLYLGHATVVAQAGLVGIFDLDTATVMKSTREFLRQAQARGEVAAVGDELPKSFVVTTRQGRQTVYLTVPSTATLHLRCGFCESSIN
jgi:hypothetical protein